MSFLSSVRDKLRKNPELFFEKRVPQKSPQFEEGRSIIEQIKEKDKMLSYPYESIRPFLNLLNEAAHDKSVVSIKMTLYRLARHKQSDRSPYRSRRKRQRSCCPCGAEGQDLMRKIILSGPDG